jgi:hypothetical protein
MASTSYCDITSLRVALVQHAAEIAIRVLGEPNLRLCGERELRFGNRGSLAVAIDGPKAGQWYDHENGEGGDLIDLIQRERCSSFRDAITTPRNLLVVRRNGALGHLARRRSRFPRMSRARPNAHCVC